MKSGTAYQVLFAVCIISLGLSTIALLRSFRGQSFGEKAAIYLWEKSKFDKLDHDAVEQFNLLKAVKMIEFKESHSREPDADEIKVIEKDVDDSPAMVKVDLALQDRSIELSKLKADLDEVELGSPSR